MVTVKRTEGSVATVQEFPNREPAIHRPHVNAGDGRRVIGPTQRCRGVICHDKISRINDRRMVASHEEAAAK